MTTRSHLPADAAEARFDQARFDQALRDHHSVAVERISPRVRAQLAQRRHAALRGTATARPALGLRHLAAGVAMAAVLALGLQLLPTPKQSTPADGAVARATTPTVPNSILDEDPEFYAWLASADVQQLAME